MKSENSETKKLGRLPGDPGPAEMRARMVRVDQAGEFGAKRIYAGQLAVLGGTPVGEIIREMAETEDRHLEKFDTLLVQRRVRPTALMPLWHVAGFVLGAGTALMGEKAAMACTVAVEEVIAEHYAAQADRLGDGDPELRQVIDEFRQDEIEHKNIGLAAGAEQAPGYEVLSTAIKAGSRLAIWLSERI